MKKLLKVSGVIEIDEETDLPSIGSQVKATIVAEVDGEHKDRRKRRGGKFFMEKSAPATIDGDRSVIESIAPPTVDPELPLEDNGEDEDEG